MVVLALSLGCWWASLCVRAEVHSAYYVEVAVTLALHAVVAKVGQEAPAVRAASP